MAFYIVGFILLGIILLLWIRYSSVKKELNTKNIALDALQKKSQKQFKAQQEYISILSKELRIPLYGIMGLTNLITEEHPEFENNNKFKSLKFTGDYLLTLINNVLHVNYLDAEQITPQNIVFNLDEVTQNIVHSFSYATENSDNKLIFEFDKKIDNVLKGDPAILSQILMNLINNALRFTKNGNVVFSVHLIKRKENINTVSFKISHDGNEISLEDQKSIYKEFINLEKAKKSYLGTGLNSKIVKRLAKIINGEVLIENNSSGGSEYAFVVDLESHHTKKTTNPPQKTEKKNPKLSALIVDDNKLNLLVAEKMLSSENFDCTTTDNGFDAIDLAKQNEYDVILMDINMPKLNGIGTTKRIREFNLKTPVIALTAVDVTQLNRQIIQAGLNDYLLKPYNKSNLIEIIQKHLENSLSN